MTWSLSELPTLLITQKLSVEDLINFCQVSSSLQVFCSPPLLDYRLGSLNLLEAYREASTLLSWATRRNDSKLVRWLLDPNQGFFTLTDAAKTFGQLGWVEELQELLETNPEARVGILIQALEGAVKNRNPRILEWALENQAGKDKEASNLARRLLFEVRDLQLYRRLRVQMNQVDHIDHAWNSLVLATSLGNLQLIPELLNELREDELDQAGLEFAIPEALLQDQVEVLDLLLKEMKGRPIWLDPSESPKHWHGKYDNLRRRTVYRLDKAIEKGHRRVLTRLREWAGPALDPLIFDAAVRVGDLKLIRELAPTTSIDLKYIPSYDMCFLLPGRQSISKTMPQVLRIIREVNPEEYARLREQWGRENYFKGFFTQV